MADTLGGVTVVKGPDLRIGSPERELAREALQEHLDAERIDAAEFEQRLLDCQAARTRTALEQVFADLPDPHPQLTKPADDADDEAAGVVSGMVALMLGVPVSIVMGFVYGAWWSLAVTAGITVLLVFAGQTWGGRQR
ncbi:hypothetical protein Aca07nite_55200 [Actinoplanes capillaceus]|uniref:DUF1707 domain-containing protein n=1 Tax=Actinoplanes campanulatus TaxID=113559 RepID=A0ABQ3WPN7_9ACTN|nr:hypothetical protein Aca07nite_55200 [Actinoplanes capillaceus]